MALSLNGQYREIGIETVGTVKTQLSGVHNYGFQGLRDVSVAVYNGGGATFTSGVVEFSPDGEKWGTLDGSTFANTGSNVFLWAKYNIPNFFLRVSGAVASGSTAVATTFFVHP